jgi:hypothetical protein
MSEAWLDDAQVWLEFTSLTCPVFTLRERELDGIRARNNILRECRASRRIIRNGGQHSMNHDKSKSKRTAVCSSKACYHSNLHFWQMSAASSLIIFEPMPPPSHASDGNVDYCQDGYC